MRASPENQFQELVARLNGLSTQDGMPLPGREEEWQRTRKEIAELVKASKTPRRRELEAELKRLLEPGGNNLRYWQVRGAMQAESEEDSYAFDRINQVPTEMDRDWLLWCVHESLGYAEEIGVNPYFGPIHDNTQNAMKALRQGRWEEARGWLAQVQLLRKESLRKKYKALKEEYERQHSIAGRSNKKQEAILQAVEEQLRKRKFKNITDLVKSFPPSTEEEEKYYPVKSPDGREFCVYVDVPIVLKAESPLGIPRLDWKRAKLVQRDLQTGINSRGMSIRTLETHMPEIRKKIREITQ